jgi:Bardet-Biedl syndrome 2 protein
VHNPHEQQSVPDSNFTGAGAGAAASVAMLNINRELTALAVGRLGAAASHDALLVGTATSLQAYDVHANADLFYKEVPDGVRTVVAGALPHRPLNLLNGGGPGNDGPGNGSRDAASPREASPAPQCLALVGGNCSITGFDATGQEAFWTVCGDNVGAMALLASGKGSSGKGSSSSSSGLPWADLAVGCDDFALRFFKGEELFAEAFEADRFVALAQLNTGRKSGSGSGTGGGGTTQSSSSGGSASSGGSGSKKAAAAAAAVRVAYGLANGTVGVYEGGRRVWRVKSKHRYARPCCKRPKRKVCKLGETVRKSDERRAKPCERVMKEVRNRGKVW